MKSLNDSLSKEATMCGGVWTVIQATYICQAIRLTPLNIKFLL